MSAHNNAVVIIIDSSVYLGLVNFEYNFNFVVVYMNEECDCALDLTLILKTSYSYLKQYWLF